MSNTNLSMKEVISSTDILVLVDASLLSLSSLLIMSIAVSFAKTLIISSETSSLLRRNEGLEGSITTLPVSTDFPPFVDRRVEMNGRLAFPLLPISLLPSYPLPPHSCRPLVANV